MIDGETVESVKIATILAPLPEPVRFGNWVMRHREFALCAVRSTAGQIGYGICYTRDGPVAEIVRRVIAPRYVGEAVRPLELFRAAAASNNAILASGVGLRALSMVDIATWDLAAKMESQSIESYLGGEPRPLPATAIIGYPPTMSPEDIGQQVERLRQAGWNRFKQPIAATTELTMERLRAAREAAPDSWLGIDLNWVCRSVDDVVKLSRAFREFDLGWIEDVMPPGNASAIAEARRRSDVPIAMGDEQGGSYFPEALLAASAVDIQRVDATTDGGLSCLPGILTSCEESGIPFAPHMFPIVHSRVLGGLGYEDVPIEWAPPGTGVDQMTDAIIQPEVVGGYMQPLPETPGFGPTVSRSWLEEQQVTDPDHLREDI